MNGASKSQSNEKEHKSRYKALSIEEIGNKKWPKIDWLED
jgi:hypothetical protein